MFIRVSQERVIGGQMRTPGEVAEVSEEVGRQAIHDGYGRKTTGSAKTKEPKVKAAAPIISANTQHQPVPPVVAE